MNEWLLSVSETAGLLGSHTQQSIEFEDNGATNKKTTELEEDGQTGSSQQEDDSNSFNRTSGWATPAKESRRD